MVTSKEEMQMKWNERSGIDPLVQVSCEFTLVRGPYRRADQYGWVNDGVWVLGIATVAVERIPLDIEVGLLRPVRV